MKGGGRRTEQGQAGPRCERITKKGTPCKNPAGMRTDHLGYGRCANHGGNAPGQRTNAIRQEVAVRSEEFALSDEMQISPEDALLWAVRLSAGAVTFLRHRVERMAEGDGWGLAPIQQEQPDKAERAKIAWAEEYGKERDRLVRTAKAAVDAGVAVRAVELAEAEASFVHEGLMTALRAIKLTPQQMEQAATAFLGYLETQQAPMSEIRRELTVGRRQ